MSFPKCQLCRKPESTQHRHLTWAPNTPVNPKTVEKTANPIIKIVAVVTWVAPRAQISPLRSPSAEGLSYANRIGLLSYHSILKSLFSNMCNTLTLTKYKIQYITEKEIKIRHTQEEFSIKPCFGSNSTTVLSSTLATSHKQLFKYRLLTTK